MRRGMVWCWLVFGWFAAVAVVVCFVAGGDQEPWWEFDELPDDGEGRGLSTPDPFSSPE